MPAQSKCWPRPMCCGKEVLEGGSCIRCGGIVLRGGFSGPLYPCTADKDDCKLHPCTTDKGN